MDFALYGRDFCSGQGIFMQGKTEDLFNVEIVLCQSFLLDKEVL